MKNLFESILYLQKTGQAAALVIITKTQGSTPRRAGAKMIVLKDGKTIGTMGGGDLDKRLIDEAIAAMDAGEPGITSFTLDIEKGKIGFLQKGMKEQN